jgi:hypothetical protein
MDWYETWCLFRTFASLRFTCSEICVFTVNSCRQMVCFEEICSLTVFTRHAIADYVHSLKTVITPKNWNLSIRCATLLDRSSHFADVTTEGL